MSTFAVTMEIIGEVSPAENSDNLDLVRLESKDYQFITQRGLYEVGDVVVYFPVDSLLPMWIVEALGLEGKLAHGAVPENEGEERLRNRVKTIKLRGNLSQGVVCTADVLMDANKHLDRKIFKQNDVTADLGVVKYEPPVISSHTGDLIAMPEMVSTYDIEGAQNHPEVVQMLMQVPVYITEKMEGSNWWCSIDQLGNIMVGQRNYAIKPVEAGEHDWWKVFRVGGYEQALRDMAHELSNMTGEPTLQRLTLRGEIIGPGVQGNYYKLKDHKVLLFEIERNGKPLKASRFVELTTEHDLEVVPTLAYNVSLQSWLKGRSVVEASNGQSELIQRKREGIVIKPVNERLDANLGRVFIKQRSPEYLAKSDL